MLNAILVNVIILSHCVDLLTVFLLDGILLNINLLNFIVFNNILIFGFWAVWHFDIFEFGILVLQSVALYSLLYRLS
jgi:hypothetical protein